MVDRDARFPWDAGESDISKWALPQGVMRRFGQGSPTAIAFCAQKGILAITTALGVWWHKLPGLSPIALWKREEGAAEFSRCTFSRDGRLFAAGGLDGAQVWEVESGECVAKLKRPEPPWPRDKYNPSGKWPWGHERSYLGIYWLEFSPNGKFLAGVAVTDNPSIDV